MFVSCLAMGVANAQLAAKSKPSEKAVEEALQQQKVGAVLLDSKLRRLDGKRFKKATIEKVPEYYLLYFSASW